MDLPSLVRSRRGIPRIFVLARIRMYIYHFENNNVKAYLTFYIQFRDGIMKFHRMTTISSSTRKNASSSSSLIGNVRYSVTRSCARPALPGGAYFGFYVLLRGRTNERRSANSADFVGGLGVEWLTYG